MSETDHNITPFLRQVAEVYFDAEGADIIDCCFVFPNKRSGTFFRHYLVELAREAKAAVGMPDIVTIGDLTARLVPMTEASRTEQLFTLYGAYNAIAGSSEETIDFDRFMFWGEMILSDFDDVDLYMVDPEKLFVNLKRYREVSTDFLTDAQKEILARYWGAEFAPASPDEFWRHIRYDRDNNDKEPTRLEQRFLKLWEVLAPLYHRFTSDLAERSLATRGMIARRAVEELSRKETGQLTHRRYIFVGFNVLTLTEIAIMENLHKRGVADFYWDAVSPAFNIKGNVGARFIRRNIKRFPSRFDLSERYPMPRGHFPKVRLVSVPSAVGQTKMAGLELEQWIKGNVVKNPSNAIDTAVVLPDDSLLTPMVHSVPRDYSVYNITMGMPMRTTSFASLMSLIVAMQMKANGSDDGWEFFHADVRKVASHPLLASLLPDGCRQILEFFNGRRRYMVSSAELCEQVPEMEPLFHPVSDANSAEAVCDYFVGVLTWLRSLLAPYASKPSETADKKAPSASRTTADIQLYFIDVYLSTIDQLRRAVCRWGVTMRDITFIQLLQKTVAGTSVNFEGMPLEGLQIMGVLETRALDFDNIILLSMNEHIFPRKHFKRSFIPETLRSSYGMATNDFQESIFAYYFYRLISRASNVTIYYDSRNGVDYTAEMSRYITQLIYIHPECISEHIHTVYHLPSSETSLIEVPRTEETRRELRKFMEPGGRTLSASSINTYLNCPLQFYLKVVHGLNTDVLATDYMDSSTYGTIVHEVAQKVYQHWKGDGPEVKVTAEMLDSVAGSQLLDKYITTSINYHFNHTSPDDDTPLIGEARVMGNVIRYILKNLFEKEKEFAPFDFIAAEYKVAMPLTLAPDLTVNIVQYIDRIDRVYPPGKYGEPTAGHLRIVDYKTGSDETRFGSVDELFDRDMKKRPKAMLQLLFYAHAYSIDSGYRGPLQPILYKIGKLMSDGIRPVTYAGNVLEDMRQIEEEYMKRLEQLVREILLSDKPFTQTSIHDHCKFCLFRSMCHR